MSIDNPKNHNIAYAVRVSPRASHMRIAVNCDSSVVLTVPRGFNMGRAQEFFEQKIGWVKKSLDYFKRFEGKIFIKSGRREYLKHRGQALLLVRRKVYEWNQFYGFLISRVSIKNQKTRWGSCSKKGNLNFNYRIIHLPEKLVDYLVVHELCHLSEFNHSRSFWALVAQTMPEYKQLRRELKNFGLTIF